MMTRMPLATMPVYSQKVHATMDAGLASACELFVFGHTLTGALVRLPAAGCEKAVVLLFRRFARSAPDCEAKGRCRQGNGEEAQ